MRQQEQHAQLSDGGGGEEEEEGEGVQRGTDQSKGGGVYSVLMDPVVVEGVALFT